MSKAGFQPGQLEFFMNSLFSGTISSANEVPILLGRKETIAMSEEEKQQPVQDGTAIVTQGLGSDAIMTGGLGAPTSRVPVAIDGYQPDGYQPEGFDPVGFFGRADATELKEHVSKIPDAKMSEFVRLATDLAKKYSSG